MDAAVKRERPVDAEVLGAALMIAGVVGVVGAAYVLFETIRNVDSSGKFQMPGWDGWETLVTALALFWAAVGALALFTGRGILAGRAWARWLTLIAAVVAGVFSAPLLVELILTPAATYPYVGVLPASCALAIACLLRPKVTRWFRQPQAPGGDPARERPPTGP